MLINAIDLMVIHKGGKLQELLMRNFWDMQKQFLNNKDYILLKGASDQELTVSLADVTYGLSNWLLFNG